MKKYTKVVVAILIILGLFGIMNLAMPKDKSQFPWISEIIFWALVAWLVIYFRKRALNKRIARFEAQRGVVVTEKVSKESGLLIGGAAGKGGELLKRIGEAIQKDKVPNAVLTTREVSIGGGDRHTLLVIADSKFKGNEVLVGAYDYGSRLETRWYVVEDTPESMAKREIEFKDNEKKTLRKWRRVADKLGYKTAMNKSDRDIEEIGNFISVIWSIVEEEVRGFVKAHDFDFSKVGDHTRGFTNI